MGMIHFKLAEAVMFEGALEVATQMADKVSTIKNQRDNRRVRIAKFFDKVGTCLEKILEAVDAKQPIDDHIEEIEIYVNAFSSAVGDIIGFELTDRLVGSLRNAFNEDNFKKLTTLPDKDLLVEKETLKKIANKFIDLWGALN